MLSICLSKEVEKFRTLFALACIMNSILNLLDRNQTWLLTAYNQRLMNWKHLMNFHQGVLPLRGFWVSWAESLEAEFIEGKEGLSSPTLQLEEQSPLISVEKCRICTLIVSESWHLEEIWCNTKKVKWEKKLL